MWAAWLLRLKYLWRNIGLEFFSKCQFLSLKLTMWLAWFFRKKIVLGIIFTFSLTYCILSFVYEPTDHVINEVDVIPSRQLDNSFLWHSNNEDDNSTVKITLCRNSVQGTHLIVDDKGYICSRSHILTNGCCNTELKSSQRYSCETCKENGCCRIYEYCISCCLDPNKKDLLQNMLGKASETFRVLFASVTDHFELCLAKCRTNSLSVLHENLYKDPSAKYCYGDYSSIAVAPDNQGQ
uniref:SREBP regulating gene protein n=1 Tax=Clastoptera arizonana TaxID=38151 RepID=A0A1B6E552_9HEMI